MPQAEPRSAEGTGGTPSTGPHGRVPRKVLVYLAVGLVAASQSGNIIRLGEAHPIAIVAWRLLLAALVLAPVSGSGLARLARLRPREVVMLALAGVALAFHLFAWTAAVQLTTVANAATFFSINPVITATFGYLVFRERVSARLFVSIALGVAGVAVIGWNDVTLAPEHLKGDGAALVCSFLFTLYFLLGKRLRMTLPTTTYVTAVYAVAAVAGFAAMAILGIPVLGYGWVTWLCFALMALVPTVMGHTALNNALGHLPAGWISAATLSEPLLAGLVALVAWGEPVTWRVGAGYLLICVSVLVLVLDRPPGPAHAPTVGRS